MLGTADALRNTHPASAGAAEPCAGPPAGALNAGGTAPAAPDAVLSGAETPLPDAADLDRGPQDARRGPARRCLVTRQSRPVDELIRFVAAPDGAVVPDLARKLPGRGAWVTANRAAIAEAARKQLFARALKTAARASERLADDVEALLDARARDALGLAAKAGLVVTGFVKVTKALEREPVVAVIAARDAAADGASKIAQALRVHFGDDQALPTITRWPGAELDLALGRSNVVHGVLLAGPASDAFLVRSTSLDRYGATLPGGVREPVGRRSGPERRQADAAATERTSEGRTTKGAGRHRASGERTETE